MPNMFDDAPGTSSQEPGPPAVVVEEAAWRVAPDAYAGQYRTGPGGVTCVGFTRDVQQNLAAMRGELPDMALLGVEATNTLERLRNIHEQITQAMIDGHAPEVNTAGLDFRRNVVAIGMRDPASQAAQALANQYGSAVAFHSEGPLLT